MVVYVRRMGDLPKASDMSTTIQRIHAIDDDLRAGLVALLRDVIEGNGSVGFDGRDDDAVLAAYWADVGASLGDGLQLWVAKDEGRVVGSVQLAPCLRSNGRHRGDLQKMMVVRAARGQGLGTRLLTTAEAHALERGLRLLVLDTMIDSPADAMYRRAGWIEVGTIPGYASDPSGVLLGTRYFYKPLG